MSYPTLCTRCGEPADYTVTEDYAYCQPCEEDFQASMRHQYPHGQCQGCGWHLNEDGHCGNEGGCSNWSDPSYEYDGPEDPYDGRGADCDHCYAPITLAGTGWCCSDCWPSVVGGKIADEAVRAINRQVAIETGDIPF